MKLNTLVLGVAGALVTGILIGTQSSIGSRVGEVIGPLPTGILMNVFGGMLAGLLFIFLRLNQGSQAWQIPGREIGMLVIAGGLGVLIITGVAFSLQRTGVTAGIAALILGQLLISTVVDTTGWGGAEPIPLNGQRIMGLIVMALAVYLLLPRQE